MARSIAIAMLFARIQYGLILALISSKVGVHIIAGVDWGKSVSLTGMVGA